MPTTSATPLVVVAVTRRPSPAMVTLSPSLMELAEAENTVSKIMSPPTRITGITVPLVTAAGRWVMQM